MEATLGNEHPFLGYHSTCIARALVQEGKAHEALPWLDRAVAIRSKSTRDPVETADTGFVLAQALWDTRKDRSRALELAKQAHAAYVEANNRDFDVREIAAWLAER